MEAGYVNLWATVKIVTFSKPYTLQCFFNASRLLDGAALLTTNKVEVYKSGSLLLPDLCFAGPVFTYMEINCVQTGSHLASARTIVASRTTIFYSTNLSATSVACSKKFLKIRAPFFAPRVGIKPMKTSAKIWTGRPLIALWAIPPISQSCCLYVKQVEKNLLLLAGQNAPDGIVQLFWAPSSSKKLLEFSAGHTVSQTDKLGSTSQVKNEEKNFTSNFLLVTFY